METFSAHGTPFFQPLVCIVCAYFGPLSCKFLLRGLKFSLAITNYVETGAAD